MSGAECIQEQDEHLQRRFWSLCLVHTALMGRGSPQSSGSEGAEFNHLCHDHLE